MQTSTNRKQSKQSQAKRSTQIELNIMDTQYILSRYSLQIP